MSNILAIAQKELKSYFASPIAYIVIGFSAILFGWFFVNLLYYFDRMSLQAGIGQGEGRRLRIRVGNHRRMTHLPQPARDFHRFFTAGNDQQRLCHGPLRFRIAHDLAIPRRRTTATY